MNINLSKSISIMKKNLTSLTNYAGCSGKVMETGNHFKNGAMLKSLRSRVNFKDIVQ
jgi:hypothetical protein